ncbi:regulatory protein RecX [uncultured Muriicola sp.]|uniref:regulatory protein RecX n=1 Tax=uncultured Muriicola sp. TaxID=1583102 RepID=UPI00260E5347|nr:regulatory protein RecX [uncultured Muriicola sp.]
MLKRPTYTLSEASRKLEYYCAYQDRCHQEVLMKLRQMNMIPAAIDHIIGNLIQQDYLNEERFARNYARGKFNHKHWGRIRITQELKKRNISPINIKIALRELDDSTYLSSLETLAKKKLDQLKGKEKEVQKRKLTDYLLYRGWESSLVYEQVFTLIPN